MLVCKIEKYNFVNIRTLIELNGISPNFNSLNDKLITL